MSESGCSEVLDYGDQSLDPGKVQARFQERISQVSTENLEKTRESWGCGGVGVRCTLGETGAVQNDF